jgi:hypothetical protein
MKPEAAPARTSDRASRRIGWWIQATRPGSVVVPAEGKALEDFGDG